MKFRLNKPVLQTVSGETNLSIDRTRLTMNSLVPHEYHVVTVYESHATASKLCGWKNATRGRLSTKRSITTVNCKYIWKNQTWFHSSWLFARGYKFHVASYFKEMLKFNEILYGANWLTYVFKGDIANGDRKTINQNVYTLWLPGTLSNSEIFAYVQIDLEHDKSVRMQIHKHLITSSTLVMIEYAK